jgi:nucleoprotein TPR
MVCAYGSMENQAKEVVAEVEMEWAGVGKKSERREATLREEVEHERKAHENAEKQVDRLESIVDRMGRGELPIHGHTPMAPLQPSDPMDELMMALSPTMAMATKAQRSG